MAARVESAEIAIQFALRGTNAGLIPDYQGRVDGCHRAPASGLRSDPARDLVHPFQPGDVSQTQRRVFQNERRQTAGLSIPAQIHSDEGVHSAINSTASPTAIRPGATT